MLTSDAAETIAADRRHDRLVDADRSRLVATAADRHPRPWWTLFWAGSPGMPAPRPTPAPAAATRAVPG